MGANDPFHNHMGKLDFWMGRQLVSYQKEYYPTTRVRPLPARVIQYLDTTSQGTTSRNTAISNLTWFAFFFLLRTGKYCKGGTNTSQNPFSIKAIQLFILQHPYNSATASNAVLAQADFFSLLLTTQKNGVKGDSIGHSFTGHHQDCPAASMHR